METALNKQCDVAACFKCDHIVEALKETRYKLLREL